MKHSNKLNMYKLHSNVPADQMPGGGGNNNPPNASSNTENNSGNNTFDYTNLWSTNKQNANAGDSANKGANGSGNNNANSRSAEDVFSEHVKSLGFGKHGDALTKALNSGDGQQTMKVIADIQTDTYRSAMLNVNKMVQAQLKNLEDRLTANTSASVENAELLKQLYKEVPFAESPAYAPLAQAVLEQMLNQEVKGKPMTKAQALSETKKYFNDLAKKIGDNSNGGNSNNGNKNQGSNNQEPDWVALLGGK